MRYLLWAAGFVSVLAAFSIFAEAGQAQDIEPARVAPKTMSRVPASNLDPIPTAADEAARSVTLPQEFEGASIEVGFTQDDEPEPHLFAIGSEGRVQLFQLDEAAPEVEHRVARAPIEPPHGGAPKLMPVATFVKRMHQVLADNFFTSRQPKPKKRCKDRYVLRIKMGSKFRERRGCTNQAGDPFAGFAQLIFRDAFIVWSRTP